MSAHKVPRILQHGLPPPTEADILRQVRDYLRLKGWFVIRIQQSMGAHKGISDLIAILAGRVLWIEVKTPTGRLSEHQERFRHEILTKGGEYVVARRVEDVAVVVGPSGQGGR